MSEFISLLIAGIVTGSIYAVSASGLVVTYNTTGIFNFAHGAVGHGPGLPVLAVVAGLGTGP